MKIVAEFNKKPAASYDTYIWTNDKDLYHDPDDMPNVEALAARWPSTTGPYGASEADAAKAAADLARWERRLKMARTKVRKYRTRVRYYEKKQTTAIKGAK
jgi:hypothetical protein